MIEEEREKLFEIFKPITRQELDERFINQEPLGQGSSSTVKLAYDTKYGRKVAIKEQLYKRIKNSLQYIIRQSEISSFEHENLMKIYECRRVNNSFYLITEFCELGTLDKYFQNHKGQSNEEKLTIFLEIVKGIKVLHLKKIMHRDIKPQNIFLSQNQDKMKVKIGDFGCCKIEQLANTIYIGTPLYSDPITMREQYTLKCDIFSLGVILLQFFQNQYPFSKISHLPLGQFRNRQDQILLRLKKFLNEKNLPEEVKVVIYGCLVEERKRFTIIELENQICKLIEKVKEEKQIKQEKTTNSKIEENMKDIEIVQEEEEEERVKISSSISQEPITDSVKQKFQIQKTSSLHGRLQKKENFSKLHKTSMISMSNQSTMKLTCSFSLSTQKNNYFELKKVIKKTHLYLAKLKQNMKKLKDFDLHPKDKNSFLLFCLIINYKFLMKIFPTNTLKVKQLLDFVQQLAKWFSSQIQELLENVEENRNEQTPPIRITLLKLLKNYQTCETDEFESYLIKKIDLLKRLKEKEKQVLNNLIYPCI